jgi:signal peptidase I
MPFKQTMPIAADEAFGAVRSEPRQFQNLLCIALWSTIAFLLIQRFVITAAVVDGRSMLPTLSPGDRYFVNCWLPRFRQYQHGDIVVIRDRARNDLMVKRIIGLPNDRILLYRGDVYVNGLLLSEPYLPHGTQTYSAAGLASDYLETKVAVDSFFVLGDNRSLSEDSRFYGVVDHSAMVGLISR